MGRNEWAEGHQWIRQRPIDGILKASYSLNNLAEASLVDRRRAARFREKTHLADFSWYAAWSAESGRHPTKALSKARGRVILIHGWDGSHAIWESIPARICRCNPRLFVLAPDVNGFGSSPFAETPPPLTACDPAAVMRAVENWVDLLRLRSSSRAHRRYRVLTFVGHSMGGAAVFYLREARWRPHEVTRLAVAPALLLKDLLRREFYKTLGLGIWAGSTTETLGWLKNLLAPHLIDALIGNASRAVKKEHLRVFKNTPKGVVAQTLYAMGAVPNPVRPRRWNHFRVILGHKDRLVGVEAMLLILEELGFTSNDLRVVLGDHYLFSVGQQSRRLHSANRELLVEEILRLHEQCRQAQRRATQ
jgi:pimeloyl-ACP methyl ester carboxylesterase